MSHIHHATHLKRRYGLFLLIVMLLIAACAPDDLDITPTVTNTPIPTPSLTPTPNPDADAEAETSAETGNTEIEAAIDTLIAALPNRLPAGAIEWRRDYSRGEDGISPLTNVQAGGSGVKVYYNEQTGGQMNLSFAFFDDAEAAKEHYEFIKGIRSVLDTGRTEDNFPQPNLFGSGLYGSIAIFQVANAFIEVNIELFSSTQGNPLVPLSRATINTFNAAMGLSEETS
ncbi:hypothetical protein G4Y79_10120 [Phototrophicus methaneseepsis]|uniref:Lipoprotein n=1 Tax=Phototrophicus methaneseepsis TaxID=2710758 RepID=A0A7S8ED01_9CHLR|nr:hypothetical protein [Phototrophicus methaneseepsis]QPC84708.1 hypothetical protein G4Y79_10120 [Phototrophicus methaneseepsis]